MAYVEVLEFPIIEEEKGTGVPLGWVGTIDQPQIPFPSSQFQEEVVFVMESPESMPILPLCIVPTTDDVQHKIICKMSS